MLDALARGRRIAVEAYTLHGRVLHALEAAARRGARVSVRLEGAPHDDARQRLGRENRRIVAELRRAGADATLGHGLHAKTVAIDGALYLDDQNWGTNDLVLRDDDPSEIATIPKMKHEALAQEACLLRSARAGDGIIVESESFGCCNAVYSALNVLARAGAAPRLLVCARELRGDERERVVLGALVRNGVRVRVTNDSEKFALAGERAWIGSANATVAFGAADLTDWGLATTNATIVDAIRRRVETQWARASDFFGGP